MRLMKADEENETWLPVVGYEKLYDVSSLGRVRRTGKDCGATVGRVLVQRCGSGGYMYVGLYAGHKVRRGSLVHRVVCEAFHGTPLHGMQVNHKDGNRQNNRASNLEWVTKAENERHAWEELDNKIVAARAKRRLTTEQLRIADLLIESGIFTESSLGRIMNVPQVTIWRSLRAYRDGSWHE